MDIKENFSLTGPVSLVVERKPSIKLRGTPTIVVCLPIGAKDVANVFETPDGQSWASQGIVVPACVPLRWALNHMQIVVPLNTSMTYLAKWGVRSAEARQHMTMNALALNPDYILYWDDDVIVPPLGIFELYNFMQQNPDAGLVSGVYCTRPPTPIEPFIYKQHGEGAYWGFEAGPDAKPEEIWSAGAGLLLVRTSSIRKAMELHPNEPLWADEQAYKLAGEEGFDELDPNNRTMWGHDIRFCRLIAETGDKLFVNGRVLCGHWDFATSTMAVLPPDSPPFKRMQKDADGPSTEEVPPVVAGRPRRAKNAAGRKKKARAGDDS